MTETAWLLVQQPNGLFARFVSAEARLVETDLTPDEAVALCCRLGVPESIAPDRVHNARDAGMRRWRVVQNAIRIRAQRTAQGVAS